MLVLNASVDDPTVTNLVTCKTTKGPLKIEIYREWSPLGADQFMKLIRDGFYKDIALFRCVDKFLTQFGISDNPAMKHWYRKVMARLQRQHFFFFFKNLIPSILTSIILSEYITA